MDCLDLNYSDEGNLSRDIFFSDYNEVNFYFEDNGNEYFYDQMLSKLFSYKIQSSFCLNGKTSLITKYNELIGTENMKKSIFIVDGDFDVLFDNFAIKADNFIFLNKYNIETYLVEKSAALSFFSCVYREKISNINAFFNFDEWYGITRDNLGEYYKIFALRKKFNPTEKVFDDSILCQNGDIDMSKLQAFKDELSNYCLVNDELKNIDELIDKKFSGDKSYIICGKIFLRSLFQKIKAIKKPKSNFVYDYAKFYLISNIDYSCFTYIKNRVEKYIGI